MHSAKNYYTLLGVPSSASKKELTIAYRRLALKLHPDLSRKNNFSADFREINEAYKVLTNPRLRELHDRSIKPNKTKSRESRHPVSLITKYKERYWPLIIQVIKKLTQNMPHKFYSDLELSRTLAEDGGYQEFAFQIIDQDSLGNEILKEKKLKISIPPKVSNGTILHLKGFKDDSIDEIHFKIKVVN